jgi:hypothetical protein
VIEPCKFYRATVRIRREGFGDVRPNAEQLDGKRYLFRVSWLQDSDDRYPGEWAMSPDDASYPDDAPHWLSSGDLTDIEQVQRPQRIAAMTGGEHGNNNGGNSDA